jgi:hypothetical protein
MAWCHIPANIVLVASKNENIIPCDADKGSNSDMLQELNTDSDDEMGLQTEGETASKKLNNKKS